MIKELKYLFFIVIIFLFFFLKLNYYFSDINKIKSYRLFKNTKERIIIFSEKLILLENDTNDVAEYLKKTSDKNKKNYNFWNLLNEYK
jgi:hypothetical protein